MRIHLDNTIAVCIDIQERLFPHIHNHEELEKNCKILLNGFNVLEAPVIVTEQYVKGLGPSIPAIQGLINSHSKFEKISFSCCGEDAFIEELVKSKRKNVILFGIETHVCVLQTAIDLISRGWQVIVVADCVSSRKQFDKEIALRRLEKEGVLLTTYESILLELCKEAGSDTFKAISKLIK